MKLVRKVAGLEAKQRAKERPKAVGIVYTEDEKRISLEERAALPGARVVSDVRVLRGGDSFPIISVQERLTEDETDTGRVYSDDGQQCGEVDRLRRDGKLLDFRLHRGWTWDQVSKPDPGGALEAPVLHDVAAEQQQKVAGGAR